MNLTHFGEQFASGVLSRVYSKAVYLGIVNRDYEGEIKKPGDRVAILSFLNDILLSDYVVGTNMASETIVDAEDLLIVEKRKYYNFSLDRLEDLFTYANNISTSLLDNQAQVLTTLVDTYVLAKWGEEAKAGSWIGIDLIVAGALNATGGTMASIVTTATGGTVTLTSASANDPTLAEVSEGGFGRGDGNLWIAGFDNSDLFKGFRLVSTAAFVTPWYRISAIVNSTTADLTEWDEAVSGSDFCEGYTLRGVFGGDGNSFPKQGPVAGSLDEGAFVGYAAKLFARCGYGYEIQAAAATAVTAVTIYDQTTLLAQALDENNIPAENRHLVLSPAGITMLRQAAELQPTGIAEIYTGTVLNGRVARFGAFDVHSATGARISTRAGHQISGNGVVTLGCDLVAVAGATGYLIPACHPSFMTFADKWSESRVVDMENQFAKAYQGLFLFGAKVPHQRRKAGAVLFGGF